MIPPREVPPVTWRQTEPRGWSHLYRWSRRDCRVPGRSVSQPSAALHRIPVRLLCTR